MRMLSILKIKMLLSNESSNAIFIKRGEDNFSLLTIDPFINILPPFITEGINLSTDGSLKAFVDHPLVLWTSK